MTWESWGNYAEISSCGRFSVSASKVLGKWKYTLWELPDQRMGNYQTAQAAKDACSRVAAEG